MSYVASVAYADKRGQGTGYGYGETPEKALADLKAEMTISKATSIGKPKVVVYRPEART